MAADFPSKLKIKIVADVPSVEMVLKQGEELFLEHLIGLSWHHCPPARQRHSFLS